MRQEDCVDVFGRIPDSIHAQTNLVLKNGMILSIDTIIRFEGTYVVLRGREGGTTDEGRTFFVPYEDIAYIKIERVMRLQDVKKMYADGGLADKTEAENDADDAAENEAATAPADVMTPAPTPGPAMDPAAIAKHNLLERIRAARTSTLGGGPKAK